MMKTIKKIDLINRIANGTEPERFIGNNILWYKGKSDKEHYYGEGGKYQLNVIRLDELNDEIELFDEEDEYEPFEEDKEIEKLDIMSDEATPNSYYILNEHGTKCYLTKHSKVIADRVNLLIDKVNSLENKQ